MTIKRMGKLMRDVLDGDPAAIAYVGLTTNPPAPEAPQPDERYARVSQMTVGQLRHEFARYSFRMPNVEVTLSTGLRTDDEPVCDALWADERPPVEYPRGPVAIVITMRTADSTVDHETNKRVPVNSSFSVVLRHPVPLLPVGEMRDALPSLIRNAITCMLEHEADEWFRRDGELVRDPHRPVVA